MFSNLISSGVPETMEKKPKSCKLALFSTSSLKFLVFWTQEPDGLNVTKNIVRAWMLPGLIYI